MPCPTDTVVSRNQHENRYASVKETVLKLNPRRRRPLRRRHQLSVVCIVTIPKIAQMRSSSMLLFLLVATKPSPVVGNITFQSFVKANWQRCRDRVCISIAGREKRASGLQGPPGCQAIRIELATGQTEAHKMLCRDQD